MDDQTLSNSATEDKYLLPSEREPAEDKYMLPSELEPKASGDTKPEAKGLLSNSESDGYFTKAAKGAATAAIKGAGDIPGMFGNIRDFGRYAADRTVSLLTGAPYEEIAAKRAAFDEKIKTPFSHDWMPNGETFSKPVLERTGEYVPEDSLGRTGMALVQGGVGALGMGSGAISSGAKAGKTVLETFKQMPINSSLAGTGQAVTEATGDPLAGAAASAVGGPFIHAGVSKVGDIAAPYVAPFSKSVAESQGAKKLYGLAEDPEAFRKAINSDGALNQGLSDSPKTAGQVTNDMGVLQHERMLNDKDKDFELSMRANVEKQNEARRDALNNVASDSASAGDVVSAIETRHGEITQRYDTLVSRLEKAAQDYMSNLGDKADPQEIGAQLRRAIDDARKQEKAEVDRLYDQVNPNGDMKLVVTPVKDAANSIVNNKMAATEFSRPLESVLGLARELPEVWDFNELRALDRRLSDEMSAERRSSGETENWRHLSTLKSAVKDTINNAIEHQVAWEKAAGIKPEDGLEGRIGPSDPRIAASGNAASNTGEAFSESKSVNGPRTDVAGSGAGKEGAANSGSGNADRGARLAEKATPTGPEGKVFYPGGNLDVRYEVVDLNDIHPSHNTDFTRNEKFPQELQPRDRTEKASQDQILHYANNLNPEQLGRSAEANTGAPIVGPDGMVESGNGRTIATAINYERGDPRGYKKWLESQGYDTSGMERPILVARRTTDLSPEAREFFADSANGPTGLRFSTKGQSQVDAKALTPDVIERLADGHIASEANRDFVQSVLSKLPVTDRGNMINGKTRTLTQDGIKRLEAAVMHAAYGDADLVERGFQSPENNIKNITGAMSEAAGPWAKMRAAVERGDITPDHDVTEDLMGLIKDVMRARDSGRPVAEVLNQRNLFGGDTGEGVRALLLNGDKVAGKAQIAARLKKYAEEAVKNVSADALFPSDVTPKKILETATGAKFEEAPVAPAAPEAPTHATGAGAEIPKNSPNMEPGQAEALAGANKKYGEYARTYKQGDVGSTLKTTGFSGDYRVMDSSVAGKAVRPGDRGYETAKQFITAAKGASEAVSAMKEQLLNRFREIVGPNGAAKPEAFKKLTQSYEGVIRAIEEVSPGFAKTIATPAKAAEVLIEATVKRKEALDALSKEAAAKFIGVKSDVDVQNKIGQMVAGKGASVDKIRKFMKDLPAEAHEGVQRALIDWMFRNETNKGDALSVAKIDRLMKHNRAMLAEVFTPEQMKILGAVHRDMMVTDRTAKAASSHGSRSSRDALVSVHGIGDYAVGGLSVLGAITHMMSSGEIFTPQAALGAAGAVSSFFYHKGKIAISDVVKNALLDPKYAREILKRVPPDSLKSRTWKDFFVQETLKSLWRMDRAAPAYPFEREEETKRTGRASGGRLGRVLSADQIISGLEATRRNQQKRTKAILDKPDEAVVRALELANQAI